MERHTRETIKAAPTFEQKKLHFGKTEIYKITAYI